MKLIFYIWLAYGPLSLAITSIAIIVLTSHRLSPSPFYRLIQCDLVINCICYLHTWIKRIATDDELSRLLIPLVSEKEFLLKVNDFMSHCFYHIQSGSLLIMCVFRYSLASVVDASEIWRKQYLRIYLCTIATSILYTLPYAFASSLKSVTLNPTTNTLDYNPDNWGDWSWIMDLQIALYLVSTVVIGLATWLKIKKTWSLAIRIRSRISLVVLFNATLHTFVWAWHFLPLHLQVSTSQRTALLFIVSDLITFSPTYILLLCDRKFRKAFGRLVGRKTPMIHPVMNRSSDNLKTVF